LQAFILRLRPHHWFLVFGIPASWAVQLLVSPTHQPTDGYLGTTQLLIICKSNKSLLIIKYRIFCWFYFFKEP
jgi:hypothetical protein